MGYCIVISWKEGRKAGRKERWLACAKVFLFTSTSSDTPAHAHPVSPSTHAIPIHGRCVLESWQKKVHCNGCLHLPTLILLPWHFFCPTGILYETTRCSSQVMDNAHVRQENSSSMSLRSDTYPWATSLLIVPTEQGRFRLLQFLMLLLLQTSSRTESHEGYIPKDLSLHAKCLNRASIGWGTLAPLLHIVGQQTE